MSVPEGVALLGIYSVGLGVPFLLVAAFTGVLLERLKILCRIGGPQTGAGALPILMGLAIFTGQLTASSYWLLRTLPAPGEIG